MMAMTLIGIDCDIDCDNDCDDNHFNYYCYYRYPI